MTHHLVRFALASAVACAISATAATAQQTRYRWLKQAPAQAPIARTDHEMVYDAARRVTVLFGGTNGAFMNDTWTYDGMNWTRRQPNSSPPSRCRHAMAYDPVRERVVLIGGWNGASLDDTWEWDGVDWARVSTGVQGIREDGSAAYSPQLGGVFYNHDLFNLIWDGKSWNTVLVNNPQGSKEVSSVYDPTTSRIMASIGRHMYEFVPVHGWRRIMLNGPFERRNHAYAIDPIRGRIVLFGGSGSWASGTSGHWADTQIWYGSAWTLLAESMQGRTRGSAMVFDASRDRFVHFGGDIDGGRFSAETWELVDVPLPSAEYRLFGKGCSGTSSYLPALEADPLLGSRPILGGTLTLRLSSLPPVQPAIGWLGSSKSTWGSVRLPLDLTGLSMPGCTLFVSLDLPLPLGASSTTGIAHWPLLIPDDQALAGLQFFQQVFVAAPGANGAGVLGSNAGEGTLGIR